MLKFVKDNEVVMIEKDNGDRDIFSEELKESFKKKEIKDATRNQKK